MKNIYRFAASLFVAGAVAFSCQKPQVTVEPLSNAIEFAGEQTPLQTALVDVASGDVYFAADAGVKTLEDLAGRDYVLLNAGSVASESEVIELNLTDLPDGFVLAYFKAGEEVVRISSEDHSAISEGTLKGVLDMENGISCTVDFSMTLVSGEIFRGNMVCSADDIVLILPDVPSVPEMEYPSNLMTFTVNGEEIQIGKAFFDTFNEYVLVTMTTDTSVGSYEDVVSSADIEFLQFMALPSALNKDIDLIAEPQSIYCWDNETETTAIYAGEGGNLVAGKARLDFNEETGEAVLKLAMELSDGTIVGAYAGGVLSGPAPEDSGTITVNGETDPVRAAFYMVDGDYTALYFTRSEVYYFDEMYESARDYLCIMLPSSCFDGEEMSLADVSDPNAMIVYMDNLSGNECAVYGGGASDATFTVSHTAEGEYSAVISVTFDDKTSVSVNYTGVFVPDDYVPEEPNEFTFNGETQSIQSALVDKSDAEIWHIYLSPVGGLEYVSEFEDPYNESVHITAPAEAFNIGAGVGFSTYKDTLKFEYAGNTWQYDDMGTLEVYLDGNSLTVDFTTYGELKGHYSGTAVTVE